MANEDVFNNMSGKMGPGTPSQASLREPSVDASIKPAAAPMPPIPEAGFYRGDGKYEYVVGPQGEITIAASKYQRGIGTVVEVGDPYYDVIADKLMTLTRTTVPEQVSERLKMAQAPKAAMPKAAMPKANVVVDDANVEIASMAPGADGVWRFLTPPAPMPEMTGEAYGDALLAAPQGGKVPPPPASAPRQSSSPRSAEPDTRGVGAGPEIARAAGEAFSGYRASVQMQSAEESAVRALVDNGMDRTAARAFVMRLVDTQGEQAIPLLNSLGDPKPYVPRARR
jgi:hypothetical protein